MTPSSVPTLPIRPLAKVNPFTGVSSKMRTPPARAPLINAAQTSEELTRPSLGDKIPPMRSSVLAIGQEPFDLRRVNLFDVDAKCARERCLSANMVHAVRIGRDAQAAATDLCQSTRPVSASRDW